MSPARSETTAFEGRSTFLGKGTRWAASPGGGGGVRRVVSIAVGPWVRDGVAAEPDALLRVQQRRLPPGAFPANPSTDPPQKKNIKESRKLGLVGAEHDDS